jgi:hypothetical protein
MNGMTHIGRSWPGDTHLEDTCPCEKARCGLAVADSNPDCPEHGLDANKTLRQWHGKDDCPNRDDDITWTDMEDGIHQKGVRVTVEGTTVTMNGYVRLKPGMSPFYDADNGITLREFGHDD